MPPTPPLLRTEGNRGHTTVKDYTRDAAIKPNTGRLRKRKFTYGKGLFAQFQTSERQPPVTALVVGKNLSQPVDLRAKCNLRSN